MADWAKPTATSIYDPDFLNEVKGIAFDAGSLFYTAPTNPIVGLLRYNRSTFIFEEWSGAAWVPKPLSVAGGGTGSSTAATARTALGIGSMGTQDSGAVSITGGTISGITALTLNGNLLFLTDDSFDIGTNAIRPRKAYFRSALVIPVGVDKYATS